MMQTVDFLDALKVAYNLTSDYQVAKKLGIIPQAVSNWRKGRTHLGESAAARIAEMLELDPAYVFACASLERVKTPDERTIWQQILAAFHPSPTEEKRLKKRFPGCILCSIPRAFFMPKNA